MPSSEGAYLVPAFTGLGAPHWDPDARGILCGLTRGVGRAHVVRAALEGVGHQVADLLEAMRADGVRLTELRVDGGMAANDWLMSFVADLTGVRVLRADVQETTALGAAFLAGLSLGVYHAPEEIAARLEPEREFVPTMTATIRQHLRKGWREAVARARYRMGEA